VEKGLLRATGDCPAGPYRTTAVTQGNPLARLKQRALAPKVFIPRELLSGETVKLEIRALSVLEILGNTGMRH